MKRAIKVLFTNEGRKCNHMDRALNSSAKAKKFPLKFVDLWARLDLWSTCKLEQDHSMLNHWCHDTQNEVLEEHKWIYGISYILCYNYWNLVVTIQQLLLSNEDCLCHDFRSALKLIWISKLVFFRYLFVSWLQISPEIASILVLVVVEIEEKRQWHWNPDGEECLCSLLLNPPTWNCFQEFQWHTMWPN